MKLTHELKSQIWYNYGVSKNLSLLSQIKSIDTYPMVADAFRGVLRKNHKDDNYILPRIHVYGFSKAQDPEFDFHEV